MKNKKFWLYGILGIVVVIGFIIYYFNFRHFTVIYDSKGGTWLKSVEVRINQKVPVPEEPQYAGYEFEGWYLNDEPFDFTTPVTKSFTLVAKWRKIG